jgi:cytochrome c oxidase assembly protein subunit 15
MADKPAEIHKSTYWPGLHWFAIVALVVTCGLIYAGGLVTTIGAGLAVPDWPTSFGQFNPDGWWKQPMVREEHGHRLIGALVGLLTLILCVLVLLKDKRRSLRVLVIVALVTVIIQGILGGLRVININIYFAMIHGCLAQAFFCVLVAIAIISSPTWSRQAAQVTAHRSHLRLSIYATAAIFAQLIIGAVMRHSQAGLAIDTFPLVDGGLFPKYWTFHSSIHYAHRLWAIVVLALVIALFARSFRGFRSRSRLCAHVSMGLVILQATLGAAVVLTKRAAIITTSHVLIGALLLASCFCCALWLYHGESHSTEVPKPGA